MQKANKNRSKGIKAVWAAGMFMLLVACSAKPHTTPVASPVPSVKPETLTVAVLPFEDNSIVSSSETTGLGATVSDAISNRLAGQPGMTLIDRESIEKILEELALSSQSLTEAEGRLKLGKLLGAQYLIVGGYMAIGGSLRIDARIIEVERGVAEGASAEGSLSERFRIETDLSEKLSRSLLAKVGDTPSFNPVNSGDHLRLGLAFERKNEFEKALEHYQKAVAMDSGNQGARNRMEALLLKEIE